MPDPPAIPADLDACAREPIHIPGSIQPHGYLFVLNEADLTVAAASTNAADTLGLLPAALIGRPVADLLTFTTSLDLDAALRSPHADAAIHVGFPRSRQSAEWDALVHRTDGVLLLELVPRMLAGRAEILVRQIRVAVERIRGSDSEKAACQALAAGIRRLTGFDRVMVYRFNPDWNGQVVAEDKAEDARSYYGHTFPASDIPPQARALYTSNTVRLIPDTGYVPCRLFPATLPPGGLPVDLSKVMLRSVSPVHLEYLANMGVAASMSVSVVRDGLLWALVACHHSSPRSLSYDELQACKPLAQTMASYMDSLERSAIADCVMAIRHLEAELLAPADDDRNYREWLAPLAPALFRMTKSQGLVICDDKAVWAVGQVPTEPQVTALIDWLRSSGEDRLVTHRLATRFPPANVHRAVASGISASKIGKGWLIWFRAEWEHELIWAGQPGKLIIPAGDTPTGDIPTGDTPAGDMPAGDMPTGTTGRIGPRKSFEAWCEQVRGQSRPWTASDIFVLGQVHMLVLKAILDDQVRQDFRRRKFETVGGLAHELNSLLQPIVSMAQMALEDHQADTELTEVMTVILDSANRAAEIVRGMLLYVRTPRKERRHVSLADVVGNELDLLRRTLPAGIRVHRQIDVARGKSRIPPAELGQIVRNLVDNAVHALEGNGEVTVSVDEVHVADAQAILLQVPAGRYGRILISDNGPGIAPELLDQIFEPFFTTKGIGKGTGLGLSIVQGLLKSRGGTITMRNRPEGGAVFEIMLPSLDTPADYGGDRRRRSDR